MSAALLREAAEGLRGEWGGPDPMGTAWHRERDFHLAVADLLDLSALSTETAERHGGWADGEPWHIRKAITVARAYLGTAS